MHYEGLPLITNLILLNQLFFLSLEAEAIYSIQKSP